MANLCEKCPITKKIGECCSSNPETGETKILRFSKSGRKISVCNNFSTDGSCEIYYERPEACKTYTCEEVYTMGLNPED